MIVQNNPQAAVSAGEKPHSGQVLKWVKNDRMAGFVPCWEDAATAQESVARNLSYALDDSAESSNQARAFRPQEIRSREEAFGFGDLIDIINPLQHIPLVSQVYRGLTGDTIRPSGRVIGGAVFGGFVGAGAGIVNVIAENETGKDVTGNALGFVSGEQAFAKKTNIYTIAAYNAAKPRYNE